MEEPKLYTSPKPWMVFRTFAAVGLVLLLAALFAEGDVNVDDDSYNNMLAIIIIYTIGILLSLKIRYIVLYKTEIKIFHITGWVMSTTKYSDLKEVIQKGSGVSKRFIVRGNKKKYTVWESEFGPIAYQSLLSIIVSKVNSNK